MYGIHAIILRNRRGLLTLAFLCTVAFCFAQFQHDGKQGQTLGVGLTVKNNGIGFTSQLGLSTENEDLRKMFVLDLLTTKHPREIKIINQGAQNPSPFVYGKLYHTLFSRLSFGFGKTVIPRNHSNQLGLKLMALVGPTLSIQRPVYLDIMTFQLNDQLAIIKSERYNPNRHTNQNDIVGYSRKSEAWNALKYTPGIGFRGGLNFYWGSYDHALKQLHMGAMIDYFPGGLTVMAFGENPNTYLSPFMSFVWSFNRR